MRGAVQGRRLNLLCVLQVVAVITVVVLVGLAHACKPPARSIDDQPVYVKIGDPDQPERWESLTASREWLLLRILEFTSWR